MASLIKSIAKNVPKYIPGTLLKSTSPFNWNSKQGVAGPFDRAGNMDSTPESKSEKPEKSYLSAAVESISNPWGSSRSSTPKPIASTSVPGEASGLKNQHGGDHQTHWHGLSLRRYPPDCPPLEARWFQAVDVSLIKSHNWCFKSSY